MATLSEIEILAKQLSDARQNLKEGLDELESEVAAIKKKFMPAIRRAIEKAAQRHESLRGAIEEAQELFVKPKTVIFHGIRLGYQKGRGEIVWEDEGQVIKLIKKHFPDDYEAYIKVTEKVLKTSVALMSVSDLKKIGVTVIETGDEVFIKPTDSEIDKLINALLKDEELNKAA
jgi:superfamily II RNA helicase